jgi:hypothetical protein
MRSVPCDVWLSVGRFFETPHDRPPRFVFVITVYLDESRHEDPDSFMVLAGFWGNKNQWEALASDWTAALGKRRGLHMKTLRMNSLRGARRTNKLLQKLGPLPYKHGLIPVYGAVKSGDYNDIVANTPQEHRLPGYVICLVAVMSILSRRVPGQESIKLVCEIQKNYEERAVRVFRQSRVYPPMNSPNRAYFSGIEFIPKGSSVLTQPSDCLAYAMAVGLEDRVSSKALLCEPILGPLERGGVLGLKIERDQIRQIMSNARRIFGPRWVKD